MSVPSTLCDDFPAACAAWRFFPIRLSEPSKNSFGGRGIFCFILAAVLLLAAFSPAVITLPRMTAYAQDTGGYCGDLNSNEGKDVTWSYADNTLTITGEGKMQDGGDYPWDPFRSDIKKLVIGNGVTSIGQRAFEGCVDLPSVTIPESINFIGDYAFLGCTSLDFIAIERWEDPLVLGICIFTDTDTNYAVLEVPGYHDVTYIIRPDDTSFSIIIDDSTGHSMPGPGMSLLEWDDPRTDEATLTVVAKTANEYTVMFNKNANDAAGTMYPQQFIYDEEQPLDENQFTRKGYTFIGWAGEEDGNVLYEDKAVVKNLTSAENGVVWLYAKWVKNNSDTEEPSRRRNFFRLCEDCRLPATGFSASDPVILSEQPKDLRYAAAGMRLMIPSRDVDTELVTVPLRDGSWAVEWLGSCGGILEGSALPGEGYSIVAAHNTLNDTEYGPFALLGMLEKNELITVIGPKKAMKTFRVFANELLGPYDMKAIAAIAEREENTLVLITCENESAGGGYLNRRAVFAKPVP